MKSILLFVLLSSVPYFSFSQQSRFLKNYFIGGYSDGGTRILKSENDLLFSGYTSITIPDRKCVLLNTDTNGNYQWCKIYDSGLDQLPHFMDMDSAKNIYVVSGPVTQLLKTDSSGNLLLSYRTSGVDAFHGAALIRDDGTILLCHGTCLSKLDQNAQPLWTINYRDTIQFFDMKECPNGDLYLAGTVSHINSQNDALLIKTDSTGNIYWCKQLGTSMDDGAISICITSDLGVVATGYFQDTISFQKQTALFKLDSIGNLIWVKLFGGGGVNTLAERVQESNDSGFVLSGITEYFYATTSSDAFYLKTDASGNLVWSRRFAGIAEEDAADFVLLNDQVLFITGFSYSIAQGLHDIFILKTNVNDSSCLQNAGINPIPVPPFHNYNTAINTISDTWNLIPQPVNVSSIIPQVNNWCDNTNISFHEEEHAISLFPNPAKRIFSIKSTTPNEKMLLEILNPIGEVVYTKQVNCSKEAVVDITTLKGIYFVRVNYGGINVVRKLIVE